MRIFSVLLLLLLSACSSHYADITLCKNTSVLAQSIHAHRGEPHFETVDSAYYYVYADLAERMPPKNIRRSDFEKAMKQIRAAINVVYATDTKATKEQIYDKVLADCLSQTQ